MTLRTIAATVMLAFAEIGALGQIPGQNLAAQKQEQRKNHRYAVVDMGTFGGPNSFLSGPGLQILNNKGTFVGLADTSIPNPYYLNDNPILGPPHPFIQHALKWQNGVVTDLGALPGGSSQTTWISDNGFIIGTSETGVIDPLNGFVGADAVLWTKDSQIIKLGTLGGTLSLPTAVNNRRQVVGFAQNAIPDSFSMLGLGTQTRAFLWHHGVMQDLGTLGGPDAMAFYLNERGQVTGQAFTNSMPNPTTGIPTMDPFLWIPCDNDRRNSDDCKNDHESTTPKNGNMLDLGTLGGTLGFPNALNNRGQVVGLSDLEGDLTFHPFLWQGGTLTDLGTLGGNNGLAMWVNDAGEVVGGADILGSQAHHAFLWKHGVMKDLGTPIGDTCSTAFDINLPGQVVGQSVPLCGHEGVEHGWLWEKGAGMVALDNLVLPGSELTVTVAFFINDRGEIAGAGKLPNGDRHAVVLVPCDGDDDRDHDGDQAEFQGCHGESTSSLTPNPKSVIDTPTEVTQGNSESRPLDARPSRRYPIRSRGVLAKELIRGSSRCI